MADSTQDFGTIIGADANFKGELSFDSAAKLLGKFEGSINAKGKFHVSDGAQCRATVKAKEISMEGSVEGNVEALDRVEIKTKGAILGDVTAARMVMADGASIDGHCRIGVNGQPGRTGSTTEAKPTAQQHQQAQQAGAKK
jgi:cytoskeletal protein CcmA (bactofilin family)